jgi:hypothetical protein
LAERSNGTVYFAANVTFDGLRTDPRYESVVKRIGLPNGR